jgi:integrase/recombinase XerD
MLDASLLSEFELDWHLAGKARRTAANYRSELAKLIASNSQPTLPDVKAWISSSDSLVVRRKRGQAVRALGKWAEQHEYEFFSWWRQVPLAREVQRPQKTCTESDYRAAISRVKSVRDRALIEVLWSCGLRRSEVANLMVGDVNLAEGFLIVRKSKTGLPRIAPLSPSARHSLRRLISGRRDGPIFGMTTNAIRLCLQRLRVPSAHAWRRGWAVESLRRGVSETSVRAVAGWSSGAMVARYTRALSGELAVEEFQRAWS